VLNLSLSPLRSFQPTSFHSNGYLFQQTRNEGHRSAFSVLGEFPYLFACVKAPVTEKTSLTVPEKAKDAPIADAAAPPVIAQIRVAGTYVPWFDFLRFV
jgi:hypothetical protein